MAVGEHDIDPALMDERQLRLLVPNRLRRAPPVLPPGVSFVLNAMLMVMFRATATVHLSPWPGTLTTISYMCMFMNMYMYMFTCTRMRILRMRIFAHAHAHLCTHMHNSMESYMCMRMYM